MTLPPTMQAVVKYAAGDGRTELRRVPVPQPGPGEVLIKVAAVGICGSDPHIHHDRFAFPTRLPLVLGHEFAGEIVRTGEGVTGFQVGDRVTAETHAAYCGQCAECRSGNYQICRERRGFGFHVDGAFAEYIKAPVPGLHRLPPGVSMETGCLTEPVCVAYNAVVKKTRIEPGDGVAVFGPGPIGLLALELAKLCGADPLIIIGLPEDRERMELAKTMGATHAVSSGETDPAAEVKAVTGGRGVEAVIDTAGVGPTLKYSLDMVTPGGQVTKIGWGPEPVGYSIDPLIQKSVRLQGSFSHNWPVWERCLRLMAGGLINPRRIVSHVLPLSRWEEGFRLLEERRGLKIILQPETGRGRGEK